MAKKLEIWNSTAEFLIFQGGYEIIPPNDPRNEQIKEFNRQLRPELYAQLDAIHHNQQNKVH